MSANGLPTPDSTPGSDPDRIAADKSRQESEKTKPSASAPKARQESEKTKPSASARTEEPALPTVPENGKQKSVEPPSDEAVVQDAAMPDASPSDIARQQRHREAITRVLNARGRYYDVLDLKPSCSKNDVKAAFRRTSMLIHPDKSDDEE